MGLLPGSQIEVPKPLEIAERLKELLPLYDKRGLAIVEVDIYLLGEVPGRRQLTCAPRFAVGDEYILLPEDGKPDNIDWKVNDIRAHIKAE